MPMYTCHADVEICPRKSHLWVTMIAHILVVKPTLTLHTVGLRNFKATAEHVCQESFCSTTWMYRARSWHQTDANP